MSDAAGSKELVAALNFHANMDPSCIKQQSNTKTVALQSVYIQLKLLGIMHFCVPPLSKSFRKTIAYIKKQKLLTSNTSGHQKINLSLQLKDNLVRIPPLQFKKGRASVPPHPPLSKETKSYCTGQIKLQQQFTSIADVTSISKTYTVIGLANQVSMCSHKIKISNVPCCPQIVSHFQRRENKLVQWVRLD